METLASPGLFYTLAVFALVIGILVFVHEYGHYGVARLFGIKVEAFAVGFGPEIFGWTDRNGTRWKLGCIPMGGYAKFAGDANGASQPDSTLAERTSESERADLFHFRPLWQKSLVVAAGPAINFAFAILIFMGFFMTYGHQITPPVVGQVMEGSPAAGAGLKPGDRFVSIDGQTVNRFEDVMRVIAINPGTPVKLEMERGGEPKAVTVLPKVVMSTDRFGNEFTRGMLGIGSGELVVVRHGPVQAFRWALVETWDTVRMMWDTIGQVITGRRDVQDLGGPVRIAQFSGQSASLGLPALISFIALVSINLGFINLLPIPMLDGGHLFLYALEGVRRRPLHPKVQEWAFMSGFALLMSLMIFLTWNDLQSVGLWDRLASVIS
ncbi:RIP metalloprotease RseP [Sandaracinobacter sp. RS1-74]|uniref:RIP metalloprotease RseP n=1 Tax=Sandaracinobacteroides sayramensis TaxID=2913411 RepID=UPI001EDC0378|nr:RIP metalloprotease RseP [Sandaracinobacteroides sayramensis]MCG2841649.1 RIP metalloprotease RseP [Sandaracinobacteroides sayramensis]